MGFFRAADATLLDSRFHGNDVVGVAMVA